jgi:flagellar protein FliO/FliZ
METLRIALSLIAFFALLFLTYVTTKYIGQRQLKTMKSKNISVVETVMLGADKRLHLVRAGNSYVLIATTSKTVEFLTTVELDEDVIKEETEETADPLFDFRAILEKYSGMYRTKKQKPAMSGDARIHEDQQEGAGFRSNLERLKTIVNRNRYTQVEKDGDEATNDK